MADNITTASFDREVNLAEVRSRLSRINLRHALSVITKLSSRWLWRQDSPELTHYANPVNLSLLAKAIVLYPSDNGREFDLSDTENNDLRWLLMAVNSMPWVSGEEANTNRYEARLSAMMRQGYVRLFLGDDPIASAGRSFWMFYEHISFKKRNIDIDAAMQSVVGVTVNDLWVLCAAIYAFYFIECSKDEGPWVFSADHFVDSPRAADVTIILTKVLRAIARTPEELRQAYSGNPKYRHDGLPDEYWCSEFNILRDFPIIALGNDEYCCPFPIFAWTRGSVGFYFDLVNHFAEIEKQKNPKNKKPLNNDMSRLLGDVFQEYVGEQLTSVASLAPHVKPEFTYNVGSQELRSPDWIIDRISGRPVFIECKARRPALVLYTRCNSADREEEIEAVIAPAIKQLCVFLNNLQAGDMPALGITADKTCICALVLYESFPFHAFSETRHTIDRIFAELAPEWASLRADMTFVPMSVQELEFALRIEEERGVLIEDQLTAYAKYRESAPDVVEEGARTRFAMHFGDYVNQQWASGVGMYNRAQFKTAERFLEFMFQHLSSVSMADYHNCSRDQWIREAAYFRWVNGRRQEGTHLSDWFASVREYDELEMAFGMPPYRHTRMKQIDDIPKAFTGL